MAAAMAYSGSASGVIAGLVDSVLRRADQVLNGRLGDLLSSTTLTKPAESPFGNFGIAAAISSRDAKPRPVAPSFLETASFTVEEARERLRDLISGAFKPDTIDDLLGYMKDNFLDMFRKETKQGPVIHIRDMKTNKSVAGPDVDERHFATDPVLKLEINKHLQRHGLLNRHPAEVLPNPESVGLTGFNPLEESDLVYPTGKSRRVFAYTETVTRVGKDEIEQGWLGVAHAIASNDPERNLRIIEDAKRRGIGLLLPEEYPGSAAKGLLVPNMVIVLKEEALRSETVKKNFSVLSLAQQWGGSMRKKTLEVAKKAQASAGMRGPFSGANVLSFEEHRARKSDFLSRFTNQASDDFGFAEPGMADEQGFGGIASEFRKAPPDRRDLRVRIGAGGSEPYVFDADIEEKISEDVHKMPPGKYPLETAAGSAMGQVTVHEGERVEYRDMDGMQMRPSRRERERQVESQHGTRSFGM